MDMDWTFKDFFFAFLPNVVMWGLGIVIPAIMTFLGLKKEWKYPVAVLYFMGMAAAGFILYSFIPFDWTIKTPAIEKTLRQWAEDSGLSVRNDKQEYARFQFVMRDERNYSFMVINRKTDSPLEIIIAIRVSLPPNLKKRFMDRDEEWKKKFINDLYIDLLKLDVEFEFDKVESDALVLLTRFYYDKNMTRIDFFKQIFLLKRALLLSENRYRQELINFNLRSSVFPQSPKHDP